MPFAVLIVLAAALPALEIWGILAVAEALGGGASGAFLTLATQALIAALGLFAARTQGSAFRGELLAAFRLGAVPGTEGLDASLVAVAVPLTVTPGFVTDVFGLLLLMPPVRRAVANQLARRLRTSSREQSRVNASSGETKSGSASAGVAATAGLAPEREGHDTELGHRLEPAGSQSRGGGRLDVGARPPRRHSADRTGGGRGMQESMQEELAVQEGNRASGASLHGEIASDIDPGSSFEFQIVRERDQ